MEQNLIITLWVSLIILVAAFMWVFRKMIDYKETIDQYKNLADQYKDVAEKLGDKNDLLTETIHNLRWKHNKI